ncbi:MAG TPA: DNA starvation/stationary phase protection protein Dps [Gammaproteobacteria bacterium]|nr:DNA starvation/stationary phase protection protein Dps [Gammaproteobacteria bacterium]
MGALLYTDSINRRNSRTKNDLPSAARAQAADLLNPRLAYWIELQTPWKQAHWNVNVLNFIARRGPFDTINEAVEDYLDLLAERIVQLGGCGGDCRVVADRSTLDTYPLVLTTGEEPWMRSPPRLPRLAAPSG